jgi:hypothetical protein
VSANAADKHLESAWEKARRLSEFGKYELIDFIEFLSKREDEDDRWEPDEEELDAIEAFRSGDDKADIPWEQVKREMREARSRVLD